MRITAKVDYAVRAVVELAAHGDTGPLAAETIATHQHIPTAFLLKILADLKTSRLVVSRRGPSGGYLLGRPADGISVADVIRAVEGPLADVHGTSPEDVRYPGASDALRDVWIATRASLRAVLEETTIAHIAAGNLPPHVRDALNSPGATTRR